MVTGMNKKKIQKPLLVEIEITNCQIKELQKEQKKESLEFRYHRHRLERLPSSNSSYYTNLSLSLKAAISLLRGYRKTKVPLSPKDFDTLYQTLNDYNDLIDKCTGAAISAYGLLSVIDEAGLLYKEQKIGDAANKIAWSTGETDRRNPDADIFVNYSLYLYGKPQTKISRMEAIEYLRKRFDMQSLEAVVSSLKRTRRSIQKLNPDFSITIPDAQNHTKK